VSSNISDKLGRIVAFVFLLLWTLGCLGVSIAMIVNIVKFQNPGKVLTGYGTGGTKVTPNGPTLTQTGLVGGATKSVAYRWDHMDGDQKYTHLTVRLVLPEPTNGTNPVTACTAGGMLPPTTCDPVFPNNDTGVCYKYQMSAYAVVSSNSPTQIPYTIELTFDTQNGDAGICTGLEIVGSILTVPLLITFIVVLAIFGCCFICFGIASIVVGVRLRKD